MTATATTDIEGHGNDLVRNSNILMARFRARRSSWDIFGLFMKLSRDLRHSTSAQSWCSLSFCYAKFLFR